ncbi:MAG: S41 family peptidase [Alistipes sp.]|nr:S41 family peptidase [Alistipes sp.]MBO7307656.1 S41 family peptidase [Alistipes sp.]
MAERKGRHRAWVALGVMAIAVCSMFLGMLVEHGRLSKLWSALAENSNQVEQYAADLHKLEQYLTLSDKMVQTVSAIRNYYVDSINLDTIYDRAIPKLLSELDPHSEYIAAKDFEKVNESLEGEFDGIGIVFNASTDTIMVLSVIPQGPSDKAGLRAGDRIMRIDGRDVAGQKIPQDSMVKLMRGPRRSHVKLSLQRHGLDKLVEVDVERDAIELHSIETSFMLRHDPNIGFVRLSQFARTSHAEMRKAIDSLLKEGMESLIIDLRGNGGGFLDQAILITNDLLPTGKLIVYTEDRYGEQQRQYSKLGKYPELDVVILVDEFSASSSEILAGAIQDNDRGLVIGRRTFGKGLVQTQIPFADGSAMRLTVARYYTPTGRSIQKPYTNGDEESYKMDIINRFNRNEFFSADSIHFDESLRYTTPAGRTVYGGGGIMPDIFIPMDTIGVTAYYNKVWNMNVLYRYTLDFTDHHRSDIDSIKSLEQLDSMFAKYNLVDDFVAYAERHGVARNRRDIATSRSIISAQLRAYIGRNTPLGDAAFYYNIYPNDKVLQRAVSEIKKNRK